ncbi:Phospholipase/carboxylesterase [Obba rivulosa]|uniref:Acyl-protein thioesterase 1 n=1 Tax=Obba rivulosa TaxID=1052685 RepID=A0A8E2AR72_9APHY|nr:Phospholipase/carboxylesterase [Obba rivulosa]
MLSLRDTLISLALVLLGLVYKNVLQRPFTQGDHSSILPTMTTPELLEFISVEPLQKHTATIIFVHGLGDSGYGWRPVAEMLKTEPGLQHIKWILPHAPALSVTVNGGMEMPAWYDIVKFGPGGTDDESGMLRSRQRLDELIAAQIEAGIPADRIVLGGFSQGGTISLLTGLTIERKLRGVVVLSGRLVLESKFKELASDHCRSIPIFWGHGTADPIVKFVQATQSVEYLTTTLGVETAAQDAPEKGGLSFHSYQGLQHSTTPKELDDLKQWLKVVLPIQA